MPATGNNSLTSYRLSIRFGADGFSFSVLNTLGGSTVQTDHFPVRNTDVSSAAAESDAADVLRQALRKPYLMDYRFQSVELVVEGLSTIVPLEHFSKSDMLAYYRLCFPPMVNSQLSLADMQYQILSPVEAVMIFRLDQDILRIVQECYPDVKVCCADAMLIEHFAALQEKRPAPDAESQCDVYLHVESQRSFIAVFRRSKLLYAASQAVDNDNDRVFLLLGIWKALELNAQRDALHLEGASRELQNTLSEYILNIDY